MSRMVAIVQGIAASLCVVISGCSGDYIKVMCFNDMQFVARGEGQFGGMSIRVTPFPKNLDVVLSDGRRIQVSSIDKEYLEKVFGGPVSSVDDPGLSRVVYGNRDFEVTFVNGELASLDVGVNSAVINSSNQLTLTFPASEAEVRRVFGKPTSVERRELNNPPFY